MRPVRRLRRRVARRGQSGFVLIAALTVWVAVSGVTMIALLGMTLSSSRIATAQAETAVIRRAVDAALEVAVTQIATDPSGRAGTPAAAGDGGCAGGPGRGSDETLTYADPSGVAVEVDSRCLPDPTGGDRHRVQLLATVTAGAEGGRSARGGGSALIELDGDGGSTIAVLRWHIDVANPPEPVPSTTVPPTTAPPTTVPTTTVPPTTVPPTTVPPTTVPVIEPPENASWALRVTSDWGAGYCAQVTVSNPGVTPLEWVVHVPVEGVPYTQWSGEFRRVDDTLVVNGLDWNRRLTNRQTTTFGFCSNR